MTISEFKHIISAWADTIVESDDCDITMNDVNKFTDMVRLMVIENDQTLLLNESSGLLREIPNDQPQSVDEFGDPTYSLDALVKDRWNKMAGF